MASDSSFPPVASSIGSAIASLSTTMKRLTREKRTEDDPERMVFSLLLNYHKSLRRGGLFRRATVRKESANPFAYDGVKALESYYYAMRLLYALNPYHTRRLRFVPCAAEGVGTSATDFVAYGAAFESLPFIDFTPLYLYAPSHGRFYIYPTFILHYPVAAHLHEPIVLPFAKGLIRFNFTNAADGLSAREGGVVMDLSLWKDNLTLRFGFSPWGVQAFHWLRQHCAAFRLPIEEERGVLQGKDLWDTTFSFVDLLCSFSNTPFSFPVVADRIQRDYFVTATALSEAYRIDWYDVDMLGTPRFTSRSFLEYLRAAVRHYKSSPYDLKGDDLVGSLSVDYFNASMLYVKRAFQFANEYMSRQPHASSRDEGVIIDLINIALSLRDYYPSCNLRSLPIMQALFMALLPDVPLTFDSFRAAYRRWSHAMPLAFVLFQRLNLHHQFCQYEYFTVKYALALSPQEGLRAHSTLLRIAKIMFSSAGVFAQRYSHEYFLLHRFYDGTKRMAFASNGSLPAYFEYEKLLCDRSSKSSMPLWLNFLFAHVANPIIPRQKRPLFLFIDSEYWSTLPFIFFETAARLGRCLSVPERVVRIDFSLSRNDSPEMPDLPQKSKCSVLVFNILPLDEKLKVKHAALRAKRFLEMVLEAEKPYVVFFTAVDRSPVARLQAEVLVSCVLETAFVKYRHHDYMNNYTYLFHRIAVAFDVNVTAEALQAFNVRLLRSQRLVELIRSHAVPVMLSMFRRALARYADRKEESLRTHSKHFIDAITADDVNGVRYRNETL